MKLLFPKIACFCFALLMYCTSKTTVINASSIPFKLTVERGAFHNDTFVLSAGKLVFYPEKETNYSETKYATTSETRLDTAVTLKFIAHIEQKGFWELKKQHHTNGSCASGLVVTLENNGKRERVICEDFDRDCPELLKYIEQKIVEMEGNNLKRVYLPG